MTTWYNGCRLLSSLPMSFHIISSSENSKMDCSSVKSFWCSINPERQRKPAHLCVPQFPPKALFSLTSTGDCQEPSHMLTIFKSDGGLKTSPSVLLEPRMRDQMVHDLTKPPVIVCLLFSYKHIALGKIQGFVSRTQTLFMCNNNCTYCGHTHCSHEALLLLQ